jgi:hypothetical protein
LKKLKFEKNRFIVAIAFATVGFVLTFLLVNYRDLFFEREFVATIGTFHQEVDPKLMNSAGEFIKNRLARPNEVCVTEWIGKDEKYVYMGIGCAEFSESLGKISATGDQNYHATRLRYDGNEIEHYEQPDQRNIRYSIRSLFPKQVYQWFRIQTNSEKFLKKGWEKTQILSDKNS